MRTISGYLIVEQMYESDNSLIYRARRQSNDQPVILKLLKETYPSPDVVAWFKREFELLRDLRIPGVIQVYALEHESQHWLMVQEDFGGESLRRLKLPGSMGVLDFLKLAIEVTEALGSIHQQHMMHKDINPANIALNPTTSEVKLIDFGIATVLSRENTTFRNPNVLEGTLAYMSPEQTGRMNRAMDYRTDFYSLGVTFYELLTGQLPFSTEDVLEMVHCHIARQPTPPHKLHPDIPEAISAIILKLMAKNAEDRYQSAYGLSTDLEACLIQWQTTGRITPFPPGQYDLSDRFLIPQKLYGREHEIAQLLEAFERVSQGNRELMLVAGYSGIGKSALVQEIYKPMTHRRGYLISGKFDQLQRDTPYSALIQAFRALILQLLTESEARITAWKEKMLAALGTNGIVITEVIPEVELIIGPQPAVVSLGPAEAQNRFNLVFLDFIAVFTRPEHPLIIFLDDLQWADVASLKLMELLMTVPNIHYLFLIGAYRDNEIDAGHPLHRTLEVMEETNAALHELVLAPLDIHAVTRLVAETLHCRAKRARPLAELLIEKTGGNPFFLNEFLKSLYVEELVTFDHAQRRWQWDLTRIQAREMTDNVVELMANRVQQLSEQSQAILKLGACIGSQFDLETLALVANAKPTATANSLGEGLAEGLIFPMGDTYKVAGLEVEGLAHEITVEYRFAHDRIQQAIYSLIPNEQRQEIHWRIGQLLVQNVPPAEQEDRIFDIVNQLNQGLGFLRRDDAARCLYEQWDELASLNLLAGKKAKAAAAYSPAFTYLQVGLGLLEADNWQWQYDLTLSLYVEAAEAAYLSGDIETMERLATEVLHKARGVLDKVKVYEIKIRAYVARNRHMEAVQMALHVLRMLDVTFPDTPTEADVMHELQRTLHVLRGRQIEDLVNLPEMKDAARLAAMRILTIVINAAYVATPELMSLITFTMVNISVDYGYTSVSAHAYASYGLILCGNIGDIESGYCYGQLALRLLERFDARDLKPRTLMVVNNFIRHWKEHAGETLAPLLNAYQSGLETGDLEFAAIAIYVYCSLSFFTGKSLPRLEQEMASYSDVLARIKQKRAWYMNALYRQVVHNLMGASPDPCRLHGACYDEEVMLRLHHDANDRTAMYYIYFNKCMLAYLFYAYDQAIEYATLAGELSRSAVGSLSIALLHFYDSLARLAVFDTADDARRASILEKVADNQQKMKYWAQHAPMNHLHKFYLVEAERCRVLGLGGEAREYYDQALALARENAYLNEEALCAERAALFYLARDLPKIAQPYLRDAHYAYLTWGAHARVIHLEETYPRLLIYSEAARTDMNRTTRTTTRTTSTSRSSTNVLDLPSVIKASQAISGEIVLDALLSKLMRILIENAGAERGVLILEKGGEWLVDAEGRIGEEDVTVSQSIPVSADQARLPATIVNYVARTRQVIVISDASQENQFPQDPYITTHQPRSILCMPLINQGKLIGVLYMENNLTTDAFTADRLEVLSLLSSQVAISIENARLYTNLELALDQQVKLTNAYSRFVPREILQFLGKESIIEVALGDQIQQDMTVLFSDIRDFTSLSEQMTPQENFDFINSYLSRVSPIIREHHGFIDKYIGDAIMALFAGQTDDAVRAAIEMQREVVSYNIHRARSGYHPISIGVGLHMGNVMLGTVGERERMEGTVISNTVNLASRLEGLTKLYGAPIIVSEKILFNLHRPHEYTFFFLDQVKVKGKKDPVSIFEILDGTTEEVKALKLTTRPHFDQGLFHYHARDFDRALRHFKKVLDIDPNDRAAQLYFQRASTFVEYGVPVDWEGIEALSEK